MKRAVNRLAGHARKWDAGADGYPIRRPHGPCVAFRTCRRYDERPDPMRWDRRRDAADPTVHDVRHHSDRGEHRHSVHPDEPGGDCHWCRCSTEPDDQESGAGLNPSTSPTRRPRRHQKTKTKTKRRDVDAVPMRCALRRRGAAPHRWAVGSSAEADRCRSRRSAEPAATARRRRTAVRRNRRRRRDRRPDRCRLSGATCRRS